MTEDDIRGALQYYKMWVDMDNKAGLKDDLSKYRMAAYECIKECLERRIISGKY